MYFISYTFFIIISNSLILGYIKDSNKILVRVKPELFDTCTYCDGQGLKIQTREQENNGALTFPKMRNNEELNSVKI